MNPTGMTDIEKMERLKELSRQRTAELNASGWQLAQTDAPSAGMGAEMAASIKPQMDANVGGMMAQNPQLTQTPSVGEGGFQMPSAEQFQNMSAAFGQIGQLENIPMLQMQRGGGTYVPQAPMMQSPMMAPPAGSGGGDDEDPAKKKGLLAMLDEMMKKKKGAADGSV